MVRRCLIAAVLVAVFLLVVPAAWAYDETGSSPDPAACFSCHSEQDVSVEGTGTARQGPHSGYTSTSNSCSGCHLVHRATTGLLFPGETLTENCALCHDGTGGAGVYGALEGRGITVAAAHRTDTTSTVPGGDASTGGAATRVFSGYDNSLSCGDCHSPHGTGTVAAFTTDRLRIATDTAGFKSDQLLRRSPVGGGVEVAEYGSDWCAACHQGRVEGAHDIINHPVDAGLTPGLFVYENLQIVDGINSSKTVAGTLGRSNFGYVMPNPRTAGQGAHLPICQQCHEDVRNVGDQATGRISAGEVFTVTTSDGGNSGDNPRFQVFPHESSNVGMLVETADDLCLNCHRANELP